MQLKEYQEKAYGALVNYLGILRQSYDGAEAARNALIAANVPVPQAVFDFPTAAWQRCVEVGALPASSYSVDDDGKQSAPPYKAHFDGVGRAVPAVCLKVPTGGGKTLLGVWGVGATLQRFLQKNRGIVLWVVPNEAIYAQTKKQLVDRDHPYRQALDRVAAGPDRVLILEKDSPLNAADVQNNLCVMLLMLQAANRKAKETLRMFRDRGNVQGFFPLEGEPLAHFELLGQIPNLDAYGDGKSIGSLVKDSLGNVLRVVRPVIVIDEGHKAYSSLALETLYGFNPSFVLELSATPTDSANRLVDVSGADLEREEMIKLPINVDVKATVAWKRCLVAALGKLKALQRDAKALRANTGRYIRPIMLVQVERTGREQRDPKYVHALDAKEYLKTLGLADYEIAIKTAEVNELRDEQNEDLLSPTNRLRVIITKQALQEGWDCPFAYVLCSLSASRNLSAMTQLVGRVLRQPHAKKTGVPSLDECYVYCHHVATGSVVDGIKAGLESDGMSDISSKIRVGGGKGGGAGKALVLSRRKKFKTLRIFLPKVLWTGIGGIRELDFDSDVLSKVDWAQADVETIGDGIAPGTHSVSSQNVRLGLDVLTDAGRSSVSPIVVSDATSFDAVYATRTIVDLIGNPWVARRLVQRLLDRLKTRGFDEAEIGKASAYVIDELRKGLDTELDRMAETIFKNLVKSGAVQFRLRTDAVNWEIPSAIPMVQPARPKLLFRPDGKPVQKSLFEPMYDADFTSLEAEFACYMDEESALTWWFRNVARTSYGLQGWRKHRVYPDFILGLQKVAGSRHLFVIETKGDQLAGLDTPYKTALLDYLTKNFAVEQVKKAGELELVLDEDTTVTCRLVFGSKWKTDIHELIC